ncbi:ferric/cupric-chelate reductase [Rhizophlyctis rosea]|nr:ferric/cupric-chelate reductase [Rhizophlyctis rosea]
MTAIAKAKQEVVLVSVVAASLVIVIIFQTVGGCFFQACSEWASFRTPHLITTWFFFGWCILAGFLIHFAQNANWGLRTVFSVGRYRMSRLRALVFSLLLLLHVVVIAYWWDLNWKRRVAAAIQAAKGGSAGHNHRRADGHDHSAHGADPVVHIPLTWQVVCSQLFRVMGHPPAIQLALTLLPVSRNSILAAFLRMDYDDTLEFHRWSGIWTLAFTLAHGFGHELPSAVANNSFLWYAKRFFNIGKPGLDLYRSWLLQTGYWSTLLFIHIIFHALPWFRRRNYTWFYINHFLAWGAIILSIIHASPMLYLALPSILLYVLDAVVRLRRRAAPSVVRNVIVEPCGYIRMDIEGWNHICGPAQWVNIRIPGLGKVMYHPFTVAGIHHASKDSAMGTHVGNVELKTVEAPKPANSISLFIKPSGKITRFTNSIVGHWQALRKIDHENLTPMVVHVDGPFGVFPPSYFDADTFIIVAGGSGISGALGIASAVLDAGRHQKVHLLWTSREVGIEETSLYKGRNRSVL